MAGVVIIGAGHGGTQAAASLRDEGYEGSIVLISHERDVPYHKPPLSKSYMKAQDAALPSLRGPRFFDDKHIEMRLGQQVTAIDRAAKEVAFAEGGRLAYERLILATGTTARRLSVPGAGLAGVFHLRTAEDARAMRAALPGVNRVAVIGGGFIGLEAAAMLAARGVSVDVLEVAPRLLGRAVSAEITEDVARFLVTQGVRVQCGIGVERLVGTGLAGTDHVTSVQRTDGASIATDMVVVGIGAVPEMALAEACGLTCDNGIVTDQFLATSDPSIYALGDCAAYPQQQLGRMARLESVQNATDQARALAKTLTGTPTPYAALPWFWSDIGALKLQIAGLSDEADDRITVSRGDGSLQSVWRLAQGRLVAVETLNSPGEHMLARRLLADGVTLERAVMASGDMEQLKAAYSHARAASL